MMMMVMMMNVLIFLHTGDGRGGIEWDGMRRICLLEGLGIDLLSMLLVG